MNHGCAAKDEHGPCGLSYNNDVHKNKRRASYHEYVPPAEEPKEPTRDELVEQALNDLMMIARALYVRSGAVLPHVNVALAELDSALAKLGAL